MKAIILGAVLAVLFPFSEGNAQTGFSYQGRLADSGTPAAGVYDFIFDLYDQQVAGNLIAGDVLVEDLLVVDGYFVTEVDFGSVFDGTPRWIEIKVREDSNTGAFTTLTPRQPVTLAPMALIADEALVAGEVAWPNVTGVPVDLNALEAQVAAIDAEVNALNDTTAPFLLGITPAASNGQFSFNGFTGTRAATEICRNTFPSEPNAHLCTLSELEQAISMDRWDFDNQSQIDEVWTWSASTIDRNTFALTAGESLGATCQRLLEYTGDQSFGTRVQIDFDYSVVGNSAGLNGNVVKAETEISCQNSYPVLCCR